MNELNIVLIVITLIVLIALIFMLSKKKDDVDKITSKLDTLSQQNRELSQKIDLEAQNDQLNTQFVYAPYSYPYSGWGNSSYRGSWGHHGGHHKKH